MNPQDLFEAWKQSLLRDKERLHQEDIVIRKFGTMFNPSNLDKLTKEDFKSFLNFRNNLHWSGIHRSGNVVTADMNKLKEGLKILLDENRDIHERLTTLFPPKQKGFIRGLGRATATPILLVTYPDKYGVWNKKSEAGLEKLGLHPRIAAKDSTADKYVKINEVLTGLTKEYGVNFWKLDELLGAVATEAPVLEASLSEISDVDPELAEASKNEDTLEEFALESQLQSFLVENWDKIDIGKTYDIIEDNGDLVGDQYRIPPIGIIDILAKSKDGKEWLVIELKKGKSSDQVVGQLMRYMGWISKEKAAPGETVRGLIILREDDERIRYAVSSVPNVSVMKYTVDFGLTDK